MRRFGSNVRAFASGLLFSTGLVLAGMTDPQKVQDFLDWGSSQWNPSLAWTLGSAVLVYALAHAWILKRGKTLTGETYVPPLQRGIDTKLLIGAALFGSGWGLTGLCPGPAIARIAQPSPTLVLFLGAMYLGFLTAEIFSSSVLKPKPARAL